jgi:ankyrin repeat protein
MRGRVGGRDGSWVFNLSANTALLTHFLDLCQSTPEGIEIDAKDNEGLTALHLAAMSDMGDSAQRLDVLLSYGADLNVRTRQGKTPLHLACRARNASAVALLLSRDTGTLLEVTDEENLRTPLFEACRSAVPEIVAMLLDAGANVEAMDAHGMSSLHMCAEAPSHRSGAADDPPELFDRHSGRVAFVYHRSNVCFASPNIENLDVAIYAVVHMLIDAGADPFRRGGEDETRPFLLPCAADYAAQHACYGMMMALNSRGSIPMSASFAAKWSLLERPGSKARHLEQTAREDILSHPQRYLSLYRPEDMDWLVQNKANLHLIILDDMSPAHRRYLSTRKVAGKPSLVLQVVHHGQTAFMERLVSEVEHYESRDSRISNPDAAVLLALSPEQRGDREWTWSTLVETCPQLIVRPLVYEACARNSPNLQMIKLLVERGGADVNARIISNWDDSSLNCTDDENSSFSTLASEYGEYEDVGADTALGYMAFHQDYWHLEAVRYLAKHGANVNVRDRYGKTPLMMASRPAIRRAVGWTLEFLRVLLELGADPTLADDSGLSCLDWAQGIDTLRVLVASGADLASSAASLVQRSVEDLDVELADMVLSGCQVDLNASFEGRKPMWTLIDSISGAAG